MTLSTSQTQDVLGPPVVHGKAKRVEIRLSNFLLWQSAYSELVFVPTHCPDFDRAALESAIHEYRQRERRFGGLVAKTRA